MGWYIAAGLIIIILGRWLLLKLFPPKPIVITPITQEGRLVIEKMFVKEKPLRVRIWESGGVQAVRLILALVGIMATVWWLFSG